MRSLLTVAAVAFSVASLLAAEPVAANDPALKDNIGRPSSASMGEGDESWAERDLAPLESDGTSSPVHVWLSGPVDDTACPWFVITHGMGGTDPSDRFHLLAGAIRRRLPRACIVRVDWTIWASAQIGGLPNPWKVATSIDAVGDCAATALARLSIDPEQLTLIGESFGNWVNARIALRLGGVGNVLAMNPASEAGGYAPPDLRKCARRSWSFHTGSGYDTHMEIAAGDFWLETAQEASAWEQHISGISWLTARIDADDATWLKMGHDLPERRPGHFQASATQDGRLSLRQPARATRR
jgi:hypothetical protein